MEKKYQHYLFDSPVIFNISGKAMPSLVGSREPEIRRSCLKLVPIVTQNEREKERGL